MRAAGCVVVVVLALAAAQGVAWGDEIDTTRSWSSSSVVDGSTSTQDVDSTNSDPWDITTSVSLGTNSSLSETEVDATQIALSGAWTTDGSENSYGSSNILVEFTADGALAYSISGGLSFEGGTGNTGLDVFLRDMTTDTYVYFDNQYSEGVVGESCAPYALMPAFHVEISVDKRPLRISR